MKYTCEYCGRTDQDEKVILECEAKHEETIKKQNQLKNEEKGRVDEYNAKLTELNKIRDDFYNDYGYNPPINTDNLIKNLFTVSIPW